MSGFEAAGEAFVFNGVTGKLFQSLSSGNPQAHAGFGTALSGVVLPGNKTATPVIGVPYQDANLSDPHLQIGQIEILQ